jgi:polyhydroxyalkanoate synthase subunit PhaC
MPLTKLNNTELNQAAAALDQVAHAALARASKGLSPASLGKAWTDWVFNLAISPGTQMRITTTAQQLLTDWIKQSVRAAQPGRDEAPAAESPTAEALTQDARFADPAWQTFPWSAWAGANKACELWWQDATRLRGIDPHAQEQLQFFARQWLDMVSPSNTLLTNPQALERAARTGSNSLVEGMKHAADDWRVEHHLPPRHRTGSALGPGTGLAMTPGQVVLRNDLIELIQYAPTTAAVQAEPVLIVPSCIMKFYILDLSPHNSMVRWLVGQGHTVYIVSWRNPDQHDALLDMDDYVRMGVLDPLHHVHDATQAPVHLSGYCLGGTFVSIAAASLGDTEQLASVTLMAAETDFSEPGEMGVLIDSAQVDMLEDLMAEQGFLSGRQMAGSFQFLHSRELVWSQRTHTVLLGEAPHSNDLMEWNADVTRLPAVMHSQYLNRMYLGNDLAQGRFHFENRRVALHDIRAPMFVVGTERDHVSPWRSVFKIHQLVGGDVCFVLTNGGHNAGIVSEPGHAGRHYQMQTTTHTQARPMPDAWTRNAPRLEGSWWEAWSRWLNEQGSGSTVAARQPPADAGLGTAPGGYVMVRYDD